MEAAAGGAAFSVVGAEKDILMEICGDITKYCLSGSGDLKENGILHFLIPGARHSLGITFSSL